MSEDRQEYDFSAVLVALSKIGDHAMRDRAKLLKDVENVREDLDRERKGYREVRRMLDDANEKIIDAHKVLEAAGVPRATSLAERVRELVEERDELQRVKADSAATEECKELVRRANAAIKLLAWED